MKKFNKNLIVVVLAIALVFGFTGSNVAHAATSPILDASSTYSVIGGQTVTGTGTTTGSVGVSPLTNIDGGITGGTHFVPTASNAAQADALLAFGTLDQGCTTNYTGVYDLTSVTPYAPGVYCTDGSFTLTGNMILAGTIGVWIFKSPTTLITSSASSVTGGDPCNVWWRVGSSTTLGTTTAFRGTVISQNGSNAMQTGATLNGRFFALSAGSVSLDASIISGPICSPTTGNLTVTKVVVGGSKHAADFPLHVGATLVTSGDTNQFTAGTYAITETNNSNYTSSFSGACDGSNSVTIASGDNLSCTITNTYHAPSSSISSSGSMPRVVVPVFQPTITILSTPVVVAPIIPKLPKTGFPPQESGTWYESLLNNILNLFR